MDNQPQSNAPPVAIPDFKVTTDDDDSAGSSQTQGSQPPPSGLLSPQQQRPTLDVPNSPSPSHPSDDGSSVTVPPSPASSYASHHFNSSLALRDNKPDAHSGAASLGLLSPADRDHGRKASISSEGTAVDRKSGDFELHRVKSDTTSITDVDASSANGKGSESTGDQEKTKKKKKKKRGQEDVPELQQDENLDPAPFHFKPHALAHLLDPKDLDDLEKMGGTDAVLVGLGTNKDRGLSEEQLAHGTGRSKSAHPSVSPQLEEKGGDVPAITLTEPSGNAQPTRERALDHEAPYKASLDDRLRVYGKNLLPTRKSKTLLQLMWLAMKDKVLILLGIAAVVSLALGFFQDFGTPREPGEPPVDWIEGVAIMVAILIVVIVGSLNDWQKERQFKKLNEKKDERGVKVIRNGDERIVDIKEVVVGDIALLEPGEIVPCDGIFLGGHNVKCDESGATGETDSIKKLTYDECIALRDKARKEGGKAFETGHTDCFVVSGAKVLEGVGRYVVVAVGTKSFNGRIMMALRGDTENTPLQIKLNHLAELIAKIGSAAGLILFVSLMIRFFVQLGTGDPVRTPNEKGFAFVNILIISVTLIVVAVPEGLPLAVTLALAFATKRMTAENLLVRVLGSCETMANASVVCTDKTGTLTQNEMTVVAGSIGIHAKFVRHLEENSERTNADSADEPARKHSDDFSIDQSQLNEVLSPQLQDVLNAAIAINSTAFLEKDPESGELVFVGSKTETALLNFAKENGWADFRTTRDSADVVQMIPFSSERKAMGVVVRLPDGKHRLYLKGASEILSKKCTQHVVVHRPGSPAEDGIETAPITDLDADNISRTIIFYANQTLRTIAVCYRDFESWPPANVQLDDGEVRYEDLATDLTLLGITGIEDPLRPGVRDAVAKCVKAGVTVKMCTGDNVLTARSIATQCGIFTPGGIIMEGPVFRKLNRQDMLEVVPRLQVLARSSPEDKKILVETLKAGGEIVGVTGDGTNDGPALKTANVGFSMGIAGTEVAKEASDIILMDDNFSSIVKAVIWGRCVNDAVRKFLQFQLSTNVTAVIITFVSSVASEEEEPVLTAVQLLWINIIMDTFAALALATDPATEKLLDRKPDALTAPLFSVNMYKQIFGQSMYQIAMSLIFHFLGNRILGFDNTEHSTEVIKTLVFNAFVFAQIFNSLNCRRLDTHYNVFEGILKNYYFIGITLLEVAIQVLIVFVGGAAFQVTDMPGREWGISIALGFVSIPLGALIRTVPNGPCEAVFRRLGFLGRGDALPTTNPEAEGWHGAITMVRDNLSTFSNLRGGRVRASSFVLKSRSAKLSPELGPFPLSSLLTMAPTLMAGAVAAGEAYNSKGGNLSDPARSDPSRSSAALWEGKLQIHPDTKPDDPVYKRFAGNLNTTV